ncbi:hypothetical protein AKJ49_01270 [candidate division MSBL1 archaeon SCGC-AAA382A03]|uniref:Adenosylcobinamide-GDP ribazoletransferase n=1 Tax=candidate division MSBL1 archaeon SCGC-AAA382A03 TaxID=1698278 RepID=A0A133VFJ3_9EURY|nr:hypothetical protein AKJ49_01270 [candidate division MSBL1 archaeon SCGC-AAA382A03]
MNPFEGLREIVSFLSIIPAGKNSLDSAPDYLFFFPVVGFLIGLIAGLGSLVFFYFLPNLVAGSLTLAVSLILTGLHHTDGLLDFGDGLMSFGSFSDKIEAMRDKNLGVGGSMMGFLVVLVTIFTISNLAGKIFLSIILCEGFAKFAMVLAARMGKSASSGSNTPFIESMKGTKGDIQLNIALITVLIPALVLFKIIGLLTLVGVIIATVVIVLISNRSFNGLTGDVFGAINEFTRMTGLIILLSLL